MRYKKAPILEAALEFRWEPERSLDVLRKVLGLTVFEGFEEPKPRRLVSAALDLQDGSFSHETKEVGFDLSRKDGSERVFLEASKLVFVQPAPYDRWEGFSTRAQELLGAAVEALEVEEFSRIGARFVNRIDVPLSESGSFKTEDYIRYKLDGPRDDAGIIEEFQMRVVKPTLNEDIAYALVIATAASSPLPGHAGIVLDIDVFTRKPIPFKGHRLASVLADMRKEKNEIFESCITEESRALFGGVEK